MDEQQLLALHAFAKSNYDDVPDDINSFRGLINDGVIAEMRGDMAKQGINLDSYTSKKTETDFFAPIRKLASAISPQQESEFTIKTLDFGNLGFGNEVSKKSDVYKPNVASKVIAKQHKDAYTKAFQNEGIITPDQTIDDYEANGEKYAFDDKGAYKRKVEKQEDYLRSREGENRGFDHRFTRDGNYVPDLSKKNENRDKYAGYEDLIGFVQENYMPNKDFTQVRDFAFQDEETFNQLEKAYLAQTQQTPEQYRQSVKDKRIQQAIDKDIFTVNKAGLGDNPEVAAEIQKKADALQQQDIFTATKIFETPEEKEAKAKQAKIDEIEGYKKMLLKQAGDNELDPNSSLPLEAQIFGKAIGKAGETVWNGIKAISGLATYDKDAGFYNKDEELLPAVIDRAMKKGGLSDAQLQAVKTLATGAGQRSPTGDFDNRQWLMDETIKAIETGNDREEFKSILAAVNPDYALTLYDQEDKAAAKEKGFDAEDEGVGNQERQLFWALRNKESEINRALVESSKNKEDRTALDNFYKSKEAAPIVERSGQIAAEEKPRLEQFKTPQEKLNAYYNILLTRMEKLDKEFGWDKERKDAKGEEKGVSAKPIKEQGLVSPENRLFIEKARKENSSFLSQMENKLSDNTFINTGSLFVGENAFMKNKEIEYFALLNELRNLAPVVSKGLRPDEVDNGTGWTDLANTFSEGFNRLLSPGTVQQKSSTAANAQLMKSLQNSGVLYDIADKKLKEIDTRAKDGQGLVTDYRSIGIPFVETGLKGVNPRTIGGQAGVLAGIGVNVAEQMFLFKGLGGGRLVAEMGLGEGVLGRAMGNYMENQNKLAKALPYLENIAKSGVEYEVMGKVGNKSAAFREEMNFGAGVAGAIAGNLLHRGFRSLFAKAAASEGIGARILQNGAGRVLATRAAGGAVQVAEEVPQEFYQTYLRNEKDINATFKEMTGEGGVFENANSTAAFLTTIAFFGKLDGFNREQVFDIVRKARATAEAAGGEKVNDELLERIVNQIEEFNEKHPTIGSVQKTKEGKVSFTRGQAAFEVDENGVTQTEGEPVSDEEKAKVDDIGKQLFEANNQSPEREAVISSLNEKLHLDKATKKGKITTIPTKDGGTVKVHEDGSFSVRDKDNGLLNATEQFDEKQLAELQQFSSLLQENPAEEKPVSDTNTGNTEEAVTPAEPPVVRESLTTEPVMETAIETKPQKTNLPKVSDSSEEKEEYIKRGFELNDNGIWVHKGTHIAVKKVLNGWVGKLFAANGGTHAGSIDKEGSGVAGSLSKFNFKTGKRPFLDLVHGRDKKDSDYFVTLSHEMGHDIFDRLTQKEKDIIEKNQDRTSSAESHKENRESGGEIKNNASDAEESWSDYVSAFLANKLFDAAKDEYEAIPKEILPILEANIKIPKEVFTELEAKEDGAQGEKPIEQKWEDRDAVVGDTVFDTTKGEVAGVVTRVGSDGFLRVEKPDGDWLSGNKDFFKPAKKETAELLQFSSLLVEGDTNVGNIEKPVAEKPSFNSVPKTVNSKEEGQKAQEEVFNIASKLEKGRVIKNGEDEIQIVTHNETSKSGITTIGITTFERQEDGSLRQTGDPQFITKDKNGNIKSDYNPHTAYTDINSGERVTQTASITEDNIDLSKERVFVVDEKGNLVESNSYKKKSSQNPTLTPITKATDDLIGTTIQDVNGKKGTVTGITNGVIEMDMGEGVTAMANPKIVELFKPEVVEEVAPETVVEEVPIGQPKQKTETPVIAPIIKPKRNLLNGGQNTTTETVKPIAEVEKVAQKSEGVVEPAKVKKPRRVVTRRKGKMIPKLGKEYAHLTDEENMTDAEAYVWRYFARGGRYNRSEWTKKHTRKGVTPSQEKQQAARTILGKDAPNAAQLAHTLWEDYSQKDGNTQFTDKDFLDAVDAVIDGLEGNIQQTIVGELGSRFENRMKNEEVDYEAEQMLNDMAEEDAIRDDIYAEELPETEYFEDYVDTIEMALSEMTELEIKEIADIFDKHTEGKITDWEKVEQDLTGGKGTLSQTFINELKDLANEIRESKTIESEQSEESISPLSEDNVGETQKPELTEKEQEKVSKRQSEIRKQITDAEKLLKEQKNKLRERRGKLQAESMRLFEEQKPQLSIIDTPQETSAKDVEIMLLKEKAAIAETERLIARLENIDVEKEILEGRKQLTFNTQENETINNSELRENDGEGAEEQPSITLRERVYSFQDEKGTFTRLEGVAPSQIMHFNQGSKARVTLIVDPLQKLDYSARLKAYKGVYGSNFNMRHPLKEIAKHFRNDNDEMIVDLRGITVGDDIKKTIDEIENTPPLFATGEESSEDIQPIIDFFDKDGTLFAPLSEFGAKLEEIGEPITNPNGKAIGVTHNGKIYLNPKALSKETTFHELTHVHQAMIRAAAKKGDIQAKLILKRFDEVLKSFVEQVKQGKKKIKIGDIVIDLSSEVYSQKEGENDTDYRGRITDELWAYLQAPVNVKKWEKVQGGIIKNFLNAVKNWFKMRFGLKGIENMTLADLLDKTADSLIKKEYFGEKAEGKTQFAVAPDTIAQAADEYFDKYFVQVAQELGFTAKSYNDLSEKDKEVFKEGVIESLEARFPMYDYPNFDWTAWDKMSAAEQVKYAEKMSLPDGITTEMATKYADEAIERLENPMKEVAEEPITTEPTTPAAEEGKQKTRLFYDNLVKYIGNLDKSAREFVEKNKRMFSYIEKNVNQTLAEALIYIRDISFQELEKIYNNEGFTEEEFQKRLESDPSFRYQLEIAGLKRIIDTTVGWAEGNPVGMALEMMPIHMVATQIAMKRVQELDEALDREIALTKDKGLVRQKESLYENGLRIAEKAFLAVGEVGTSSGRLTQSFAIWAINSAGTNIGLVDRLFEQVTAGYTSDQFIAHTKLKEIQSEVERIRKEALAAISEQDLSDIFFGKDEQDALNSELQKLLDKASKEAKTRKTTSAPKRKGKSDKTTISEWVREQGKKSADLLKGLLGTGQWQVGNTRSTESSRKKVERVIEVLKPLFPKADIIYDQEIWDNEVAVNARGVIRKEEGRTKIYLNPSMVKGNTPFHELGHIIENVMERYNPELHAQAMTLVKSSPYYADAISKYGKSDAAREAFVEMIADKGEKIADRHQNVFLRIWDKIKNTFRILIGKKGIDVFSEKDFGKLTLNDISDAAAQKFQGIEEDYEGEEAFQSSNDYNEIVAGFVPTLGEIIDSNSELQNEAKLKDKLFSALTTMYGIGLNRNNPNTEKLLEDVISLYKQSESLQAQLRDTALDLYKKNVADDTVVNSGGIVPTLDADKLYLQALVATAKTRMLDDMEEDRRLAQEDENYVRKYKDSEYEMAVYTKTGAEKLESLIGTFNNDPLVWTEAFAEFEKAVEIMDISDTQKANMLATVKATLQAKNISVEELTSKAADNVMRGLITGLNSKPVSDKAQAASLLRKAFTTSVKDLMKLSSRGKFIKQFFSDLQELGVSPETSKAIWDIVSAKLDTHIKAAREQELRNLIKNAPKNVESTRLAKDVEKSRKHWEDAQKGNEMTKTFEDISFMSEDWEQGLVDQFAELYGISNFTEKTRERMRELAVAIENAPEGFPRIRASHAFLRFIGDTLYPKTFWGAAKQKYWQFYYASMLRNYTTHLANTIANLVKFMTYMIQNHIVQISSLWGSKEGYRAKAVTSGAWNTVFSQAPYRNAMATFFGNAYLGHEARIDPTHLGKSTERNALEREGKSIEGMDTGNIENMADTTNMAGEFWDAIKGMFIGSNPLKWEKNNNLMDTPVKAVFRALGAADTFFRIIETNAYLAESAYLQEKMGSSKYNFDEAMRNINSQKVDNYVNEGAEKALENNPDSTVADLYKIVKSEPTIENILNLEKAQGYFNNKEGKISENIKAVRSFLLKKGVSDQRYNNAWLADRFADDMLLVNDPTGLAGVIFKGVEWAVNIPVLGIVVRFFLPFARIALNLSNMYLDRSLLGTARTLIDMKGTEEGSFFNKIPEDLQSRIGVESSSEIRRAEQLAHKIDLLIDKKEKEIAKMKTDPQYTGKFASFYERKVQEQEKIVQDLQKKREAHTADIQAAQARSFAKVVYTVLTYLTGFLLYSLSGNDDEEKKKKRKSFYVEMIGSAFSDQNRFSKNIQPENSLRIWANGRSFDIPQMYFPQYFNMVFLSNLFKFKDKRNKDTGEKEGWAYGTKKGFQSIIFASMETSGFYGTSEVIAKLGSRDEAASDKVWNTLGDMAMGTVAHPVAGATFGIAELVGGLLAVSGNDVFGTVAKGKKTQVRYNNQENNILQNMGSFFLRTMAVPDEVNPMKSIVISKVTGQPIEAIQADSRFLDTNPITALMSDQTRSKLKQQTTAQWLVDTGLIEAIPEKISLNIGGKEADAITKGEFTQNYAAKAYARLDKLLKGDKTGITHPMYMGESKTGAAIHKQVKGKDVQVKFTDIETYIKNKKPDLYKSYQEKIKTGTPKEKQEMKEQLEWLGWAELIDNIYTEESKKARTEMKKKIKTVVLE